MRSKVDCTTGDPAWPSWNVERIRSPPCSSNTSRLMPSRTQRPRPSRRWLAATEKIDAYQARNVRSAALSVRSSASSKLIDLVDAHFRAAGLSVRHDEPYRGGWTTGHYGRPAKNVHAVQIELNRALYMDERTGRPKTGDFEQLQALLRDLVGKLGRMRLG